MAHSKGLESGSPAGGPPTDNANAMNASSNDFAQVRDEIRHVVFRPLFCIIIVIVILVFSFPSPFCRPKHSLHLHRSMSS